MPMNNNNNWHFGIVPCGMPCIMKGTLHLELLVISLVEEMSLEKFFEFTIVWTHP